jgi:hypothetical protein
MVCLLVHFLRGFHTSGIRFRFALGRIFRLRHRRLQDFASQVTVRHCGLLFIFKAPLALPQKCFTSEKV